MAKFMIISLITLGLCLVVPISSEKQIKLEDIEKDNLKAAQQLELEKQLQQYQQYQQYQQAPVQYDQQVYTQQQSLNYPPAYYQYSLPQQYVQQQQLYPGYAPLASNSLGTGYSTASSVDPFQAYYTPQLASGVSNLQTSQHITAPTQTQPVIMAYASPSLSGLQQQTYYQVLPKTLGSLGGVQYVPSQASQSTQYYFQPQTQAPAASATTGTGLLYSAPQQFIPSYQYVNNKLAAANQQQYVSTAPQTFSASYSSTNADYAGSYPSQGTFSSSIYSQPDPPTFVSLKAPKHLVASPGQQQQYIQAQAQTATSTISPFKYLNSPQYLAQNYNTIQGSHLIPKNNFSSGVKSTVSPPVKYSGNTGYFTPTSSSSSSSSSSNGNGVYQTYRGIAG